MARCVLTDLKLSRLGWTTSERRKHQKSEDVLHHLVVDLVLFLQVLLGALQSRQSICCSPGTGDTYRGPAVATAAENKSLVSNMEVLPIYTCAHRYYGLRCVCRMFMLGVTQCLYTRCALGQPPWLNQYTFNGEPTYHTAVADVREDQRQPGTTTVLFWSSRDAGSTTTPKAVHKLKYRPVHCPGSSLRRTVDDDTATRTESNQYQHQNQHPSHPP